MRWLALIPLVLLVLLAAAYWHRDALPEQKQALGRDDPALALLPWAELVPPALRAQQPRPDPKHKHVGESAGLGGEWRLATKAARSLAPTRPELDGQVVKLRGYVVPLTMSWGGMREFLLVPYAGACIHTPPPPSNQIVHIVAAEQVKGLRSMDVVTVSGRLRVLNLASDVAASGYQLEANHVAPNR
ncbi:hypothetical protein HNP55_001180 [Paucibacter oligotrophus]|uniref:DUF3299 domain-containing protein n=1 Tax=Roseateles oligotrophus TaxID=1769250 RepID=A0A840L7M6_9BURK|nr:DUF3299 domain-containing protein [Roseateles oligotrophus]MBB4842665.1 hypothetical protein [Roseateles oligotrophus]